MDALSEYLDLINYLPFLIATFALIHNWSNIGARWLLILSLTVACLEEYTQTYAIHWTTHYYAWAIFFNFLYIFPILFRKKIAQEIFNRTGNKFFYEATKLKFSPQEAAIMLLCLISVVGHAISYVEVFLYKSFLIDVMYFKNYILAKLQLILHILATLAILSLSFRFKGLNYAATKA
ncbi:hypothetical protein [Pseudoalteromonas sp. MTN2-4]|uniref:hypothetical protein n=1 Tax=Pseudoalteromonas sp. MTN2-4 TaxID=3056555 RepID=UPI0036F38631